MDMQLNDTQRAIEDACSRLLKRAAGPARARELRRLKDCDRPLAQELVEAGFLDLLRDAETGPLAAALVTEWVAQAAGLAPIGNRALVAASVIDGPLPDMIAVADKSSPGPIRYAEQADLLILIDGDEAVAARRNEFSVEPVPSLFGFPMGRVEVAGGMPLAPGSGALARRWWRVAVAAEIAGTARAALDLTIRYLRDRVQFDRPIASFQAVQHRLVECHVSVESARWAAREAAFRGAPVQLAAGAAITAAEAAQRVFDETHQLSGAIGFTLEYDLHLWSTRLQTLRHEACGVQAHSHALVQERWN